MSNDPYTIVFIFAGLAWAGLFLFVGVAWGVYDHVKRQREAAHVAQLRRNWEESWEKIEKEISD